MAKPKRAGEVMKKFDYYAKQYGQGKLSMARAARDAGVNIWEMHSYVREHKIPAQLRP